MWLSGEAHGVCRLRGTPRRVGRMPQAWRHPTGTTDYDTCRSVTIMEQEPPSCSWTSSDDDLTCQQVIALLVEYVTDALAPETVQAFQEHLRACEDCLAYLTIPTAPLSVRHTPCATRISLPPCETAS